MKERNSMRDNKINLENKFGLTVDEAALYTGVGRNTLRSLIKNQKLPSLLIGRKNVIRTDALEEFLTVNQGINLLDFENVKAVN